MLAAVCGLLFGACEVKQAPAEVDIEEVIEAYCDLAYTCCEDAETDYFVGPYVLPAECTSRLMEAASLSPVTALDLAALAGLRSGHLLIPNLPALNEAVQDGRTVISREGLDACKKDLSRKQCNEYTEPEAVEGCQPPPEPEEPNPCAPQNLFIGQLVEGQDCSSSAYTFECAPGYRCGTGSGLGVDGRCVRLRQATETCVTDTDCAGDLYCSLLDGTCKAFAGKGETCVYADRNDPAPEPETQLVRCAPHLACNPLTQQCVEACQEGATCAYDTDCDDEQELTCILGRCSHPRKLNQPCADTENCTEDLRCAPNPQSEGGEFSCQPKLPTNAPCTLGVDCESGYCPLATAICTEPVDIGDPCPSGSNEECGDGACVRENPTGTCVDDDDCPGSNDCTPSGVCGFYCIERKSDGATCSLDTECSSGTCAAGFCRTLPLARGVECDDASQCESFFCNYEDTRECDTLPLSLNDPCVSGAECATGVCFEGECTKGLDEGESCDDLDEPPCDPYTTYCDYDEDPPVCVLLRETGEECESSAQCRGQCVLAQGRMLCSPAAKKEEAVCDGGGPGIGLGAGGASN